MILTDVIKDIIRTIMSLSCVDLRQFVFDDVCFKYNMYFKRLCDWGYWRVI
jgi:hypothetical protein